jgi:hypothetical protein
VLLWFADPELPSGSLRKRFRKTDMWGARDLFSVAGHSPIDSQAIRASLESDVWSGIDPINITLELRDGPDEVSPGQTFTLTVKVCNAGKTPLRSAPPDPVYLSYHWLSEKTGEVVVWDGERSPLLPPCESSGAYPLCVVAPSSAAGPHVLRVTLVQEGVRWFDQPPAAVFIDRSVIVRAAAQPLRTDLHEVQEACK